MSLEELDQDDILTLYQIYLSGDEGICQKDAIENLKGRVKKPEVKKSIGHLKTREIVVECGYIVKYNGKRPFWLPKYRVADEHRKNTDLFFSQRPDIYERIKAQ